MRGGRGAVIYISLCVCVCACVHVCVLLVVTSDTRGGTEANLRVVQQHAFVHVVWMRNGNEFHLAVYHHLISYP